MIEVSKRYKELCESDDTRKEWYITFPDGDHAPITEDQIVGGSFNREESLCSSSDLEFGLCEASRCEFDVIGIGTELVGKRIKVSFRVYDPDEEEWLYCPQGFYTIDSAVKNGSNRRKVTAYDKLRYKSQQITASSAERLKMRWPYNGSEPYTTNAYMLSLSMMSNESLSDLFDTYGTTVEYNPSGSRSENASTDKLVTLFFRVRLGGYAVAVSGDIVIHSRYIDQDSYRTYNIEEEDKIYKIGNISFYDNIETIKENAINEIMSMTDFTRSAIDCLFGPFMFIANATNDIIDSEYRYVGPSSGNAKYRAANDVLTKPWYPHMDISGFSLESYYCAIMIPKTVYLMDLSLGQSVRTYKLANSTDHVSVKELLFDNIPNATYIKTTAAREYDGTDERRGDKYVVNSYTPVSSVMASSNQLNGTFGIVDKTTGEISEKKLKKDTEPHDVYCSAAGTSDGQTLTFTCGAKKVSAESWNYNTNEYDDFTTAPIGKISANYSIVKGDNTETGTVEYVIDPTVDNTLYIDDNYLLNKSGQSKADVKNALTEMAENIKGVTYTPSEVTRKIMPWIEAGDIVQMEDGNRFPIMVKRVEDLLETWTAEASEKSTEDTFGSDTEVQIGDDD